MKKETQHLPQDLTIDILLKLTVKSLIRFKGVCKLWRSVISDPDFARSHFKLATPRLMFKTRLGIQTMDLDGSLHSNLISEPINADFCPTQSNIFIIGSCRGFLLLETYESLYLWNPSTRVHKPIPSSSIYIKGDPHLYGFGYDSSKDDYLVVILSVNDQRPSPYWSIMHLQFFSTRANIWKHVEGTDLPPLDLGYTCTIGLLFNEAIHWLACDGDKYVNVIIIFDLMEKRLFHIPLSDDLFYDLSYCNFWVHGQFLSLSVRRRDTLEIWVMKKYKVQSSWTKTLVLSMSGISYLTPLCSTKSGDIIMERLTETSLFVKYSDKGEQLEHCEEGRGYLCSKVPMYTETILSLPDVSE